jgi:hypothetical protein
VLQVIPLGQPAVAQLFTLHLLLRQMPLAQSPFPVQPWQVVAAPTAVQVQVLLPGSQTLPLQALSVKQTAVQTPAVVSQLLLAQSLFCAQAAQSAAVPGVVQVHWKLLHR